MAKSKQVRPPQELTDSMYHVARTQLNSIPGAILDWMPGESLYSLMAKNHFYRGHQEHSHTVQAFFGTPDGRSLQKNMSEIEVLVARTEGSLGSAQQILEDRTFLRFYRLFMATDGERLIEPGQRNPDSMLKFPMALRKGAFKSRHPLKGCIHCREQDMKETGIPYWRLLHQFPGFWVCLEHDNGLQEISCKANPSHKFFWQTPVESEFLPMPDALAEPDVMDRLRHIARFIVAITIDIDEGTLQLKACAERFRQYLARTHMLLPSGRLKLAHKNDVARLCEEFVDFSNPLRRHPGFPSLPADLNAAYLLLSRFVSGRGEVRPLVRLVITIWIEQMLEANSD